MMRSLGLSAMAARRGFQIPLFVLLAAAIGLCAPAAQADPLDAYALTNTGSDFFSFGTPVTMDVSPGDPYQGLATKVVGTTPLGGAFLGSQLTLLGGQNTTTGTVSVSMAWRTRTNLEVDGQNFPMAETPVPGKGDSQYYQDGVGTDGRGVALALGAYNVPSDVANLQGMVGPYVIQMSYSTTAVIRVRPYFTDQFLDDHNAFFVSWLNTTGTRTILSGYDEWDNAVDGNSTTGSEAVPWYKGSFDKFVQDHPDFTLSTTAYLGSFGSNIADNTVWAIVDHSSQFAATPEPGTLALLAMGAVALFRRRRKTAGGQ